MNKKLEDALEAYWNAAYLEGKEGRTTDDKAGSAQVALHTIRRLFAEAQNENG